MKRAGRIRNHVGAPLQGSIGRELLGLRAGPRETMENLHGARRDLHFPACPQDLYRNSVEWSAQLIDDDSGQNARLGRRLRRSGRCGGAGGFVGSVSRGVRVGQRRRRAGCLRCRRACRRRRLRTGGRAALGHHPESTQQKRRRKREERQREPSSRAQDHESRSAARAAAQSLSASARWERAASLGEDTSRALPRTCTRRRKFHRNSGNLADASPLRRRRECAVAARSMVRTTAGWPAPSRRS